MARIAARPSFARNDFPKSENVRPVKSANGSVSMFHFRSFVFRSATIAEAGRQNNDRGHVVIHCYMGY